MFSPAAAMFRIATLQHSFGQTEMKYIKMMKIKIRKGSWFDFDLKNFSVAVKISAKSCELTFSVDCEVPKKIGMNASQIMQVVYMVKPMGLASLKVSGTPLVLMA